MLLRQKDTGWNTDTNRNIRPYNPANHTNAAPSVQSKPFVTMYPIDAAGTIAGATLAEMRVA